MGLYRSHHPPQSSRSIEKKKRADLTDVLKSGAVRRTRSNTFILAARAKLHHVLLVESGFFRKSALPDPS